jgi:hypothetical protein
MIFVSGCVSIPAEKSTPAKTLTLKKNIFPDVRNVGIGMTKTEVESILGNAVIKGYRKNEQSGAMEPLTLPSPYKIEKITSGGLEYEVHYYIYRIEKADGTVDDNELYPIIFLNGKVFEKGPEGLAKLKTGNI